MAYIRIKHERQAEVLINEFISPRPEETRCLIALERLIIVIKHTVAILVYETEVTRFATILRSFFFLSQLPHASELIIPDLIRIMANKPPVLRVIFFLLADHIAIFIQNILHVAVQAFQLATVERKTTGRGPREVVRTDNITVQ